MRAQLFPQRALASQFFPDGAEQRKCFRHFPVASYSLYSGKFTRRSGFDSFSTTSHTQDTSAVTFPSFRRSLGERPSRRIFASNRRAAFTLAVVLGAAVLFLDRLRRQGDHLQRQAAGARGRGGRGSPASEYSDGSFSKNMAKADISASDKRIGGFAPRWSGILSNPSWIK